MKTLKELRKLADAATQGEWVVADTSIVCGDYCLFVVEDDGGYEAPERKENAAFVAAANPETIRELTEDLETAIKILRDGKRFVPKGLLDKYKDVK